MSAFLAAVVGGALVGFVNWVFNRFHAFEMEIEAYRRTVFPEKLAAYREIAQAVYELRRAYAFAEHDPEAKASLNRLSVDLTLVISRNRLQMQKSTFLELRKVEEERGVVAKKPEVTPQNEALAVGKLLDRLIEILQADLGLDDFLKRPSHPKLLPKALYLLFKPDGPKAGQQHSGDADDEDERVAIH